MDELEGYLGDKGDETSLSVEVLQKSHSFFYMDVFSPRT